MKKVSLIISFLVMVSSSVFSQEIHEGEVIGLVPVGGKEYAIVNDLDKGCSCKTSLYDKGMFEQNESVSLNFENTNASEKAILAKNGKEVPCFKNKNCEIEDELDVTNSENPYDETGQEYVDHLKELLSELCEDDILDYAIMSLPGFDITEDDVDDILDGYDPEIDVNEVESIENVLLRNVESREAKNLAKILAKRAETYNQSVDNYIKHIKQSETQIFNLKNQNRITESEEVFLLKSASIIRHQVILFDIDDVGNVPPSAACVRALAYNAAATISLLACTGGPFFCAVAIIGKIGALEGVLTACGKDAVTIGGIEFDLDCAENLNYLNSIE